MPADRPDHELSLIVGGKVYGGWLDVEIDVGIEQAARSFQFKATQKWPGLATHFEIEDGAKIQVAIGKDLVITGQVDRVEAERDAGDAHIAIAGRSKTADLVDCSPDFDEVELAGLDLAGVARRACKPFGIEVVAEDTGPTFSVASKHHGETCWKLIERMARQRQILVTDDEQGRLVLTRLGKTRATDKLVHPSDGLKKISTVRDMAGRFSDYIVKAQAGGRWAEGGAGDVGAIPAQLAHVTGNFKDPGVTRYRPKVILSEGAAKKEGAAARAEWECRRNIGKSRKATATRVWWRQRDGSLWKPNLIVACEFPQLNLSADLAIGKVQYRKSDQGTTSILELAPPEAYTPEPAEQAGGTGAGQGWGDVLQNSGAG